MLGCMPGRHGPLLYDMLYHLLYHLEMLLVYIAQTQWAETQWAETQ